MAGLDPKGLHDEEDIDRRQERKDELQHPKALQPVFFKNDCIGDERKGDPGKGATEILSQC